MKAMILAAGRGERMRPLTDSIPKPLVSLLGRPLIEYRVLDLARAGVTEMVVNLGYRGAQIREFLGDGSRYGVHVEYSEEGEPPLETGGGIFRALPLLGDAAFIVVNADVYADFSWPELVARAKALAGADLAHLVLVPNPAFKTVGDFALQADRVVEAEAASYTFSGISILRPALFDGCVDGRYPIVPLWRAAMRQGRVSGECFDGLWSDVGTPQRLAELEAALPGSALQRDTSGRTA